MEEKEYTPPTMQITLFEECFIRTSYDNDYNGDDWWDDENASPIGSAAARASVQARVREANVIPTWEMVLTRAKTTIGCNNIAWLREWFNEMNCANWCDGDGNPIHNWGRALGIAWRYKDVDAARRDPSRFQKPVDKEFEEAERRKEQQKKLIQEQIAIVKAKYLAEQEAMNECR